MNQEQCNKLVISLMEMVNIARSNKELIGYAKGSLYDKQVQKAADLLVELKKESKDFELPEPDLIMPSVHPDCEQGASYYRKSTVLKLLQGRS